MNDWIDRLPQNHKLLISCAWVQRRFVTPGAVAMFYVFF